MPTEFEFIENIRRRSRHSSVKTGIGDDCAVISKDAETDLVITTDLLVEDVDFRLDWTRPEWLGHKALAVSLSDVAAMGATPKWAMLSVGVPEKIWNNGFVAGFYDGWFELAEKFGVALVGGDVSRTPDKIVIDSIVAGEAKKDKAVLRSGARPGDSIFVTGSLGGAAGGLKLLENGDRLKRFAKAPTSKEKLLLRQLRPNPQTEIGKIIGAKSLATAMIDLSDGLSSDLAHLCAESRVGARLFADKLPVDDNLKKFLMPKSAKLNSANSLSAELDFALNGGEDFELLFTADKKKISALKNALKSFDFRLIGEVTETVDRIELILANETRILPPKGFSHF